MYSRVTLTMNVMLSPWSTDCTHHEVQREKKGSLEGNRSISKVTGKGWVSREWKSASRLSSRLTTHADGQRALQVWQDELTLGLRVWYRKEWGRCQPKWHMKRGLEEREGNMISTLEKHIPQEVLGNSPCSSEVWSRPRSTGTQAKPTRLLNDMLNHSVNAVWDNRIGTEVWWWRLWSSQCQ